MEVSPKHLQQSTYEHSTLPETVRHEVSLHGVTDTSKEAYHAISHQSDTPLYASPTRQRLWTRWPFLLLFGILIALIAGLIGGFIGKAISGNKQHNSDTARAHPGPGTDNAQASACSSANPSTPTSSTAPTPDQIVVPQTGCPDTTGRTFQSTFSNTTFKLFCNVNWVGGDIASIYATSLSDCVESCNTVNQYGLIDKSCLGATFVPAWANRTLAMQSVD